MQRRSLSPQHITAGPSRFWRVSNSATHRTWHWHSCGLQSPSRTLTIKNTEIQGAQGWFSHNYPCTFQCKKHKAFLCFPSHTLAVRWLSHGARIRGHSWGNTHRHTLGLQGGQCKVRESSVLLWQGLGETDKYKFPSHQSNMNQGWWPTGSFNIKPPIWPYSHELRNPGN